MFLGQSNRPHAFHDLHAHRLSALEWGPRTPEIVGNDQHLLRNRSTPQRNRASQECARKDDNDSFKVTLNVCIE